MDLKKPNLIKQENFFHSVIKSKSINQIDLDNGGIGIEIEGYASTKDKDRTQDIVLPEAFQKALDLYMTNPIILLQHNHDKPVGVVTSASIVKGKGLYFTGLITEDTDGLFSKLKNGVLRALSIGYRVRDYEVKEQKDEDDNIIGYDYIIKEIELFEISIVSVPANPYALLKSLDSCFEYQNNIKKEDIIKDIKETINNNKDLDIKQTQMVKKETIKEVKEEIKTEEKKEEEVVIEGGKEEEEEKVIVEEKADVKDEITSEVEEVIEEKKEIKEKKDDVVVNKPDIVEEKKEEIPEKVIGDDDEDGEKSIKGDKSMETLTKDFELFKSETDLKVKEFEDNLSAMTDAFKKTLEYVIELKKLVSSISVSKGYTHEKVEIKKSAYGEVVDAVKALK